MDVLRTAKIRYQNYNDAKWKNNRKDDREHE